MKPISVALVEDDPGMRQRLARVIQAAPSLELRLAAATAAELLAWVAAHEVDVLLVDLGLPDVPGLEVISRCRRLRPHCAVLVITVFGDETNMVRAFEAGATGYLLKDGTEADLATHVLSVHAGGSPMSPLIARQLLQRWQAAALPPGSAAPGAGRSAAGAVSEALSRRETQVLDLIARGFTYAEIAAQLAVSATTVQTHVRSIYAKLDVHNKTEAVFEARQLGLLP